MGGNIGNASPIGDAPPPLIALGAQIALRQGNTRRILPLQDYFLDYKVTARQEAEFIEKIIVPRAQAYRAFRAYKVSKRLDDDISAVCAAFNLTIVDGVVTEARIAFGGMAAIPKRASACEAALVGSTWYPGVIERACNALAEDFTPLSDFPRQQGIPPAHCPEPVAQVLPGAAVARDRNPGYRLRLRACSKGAVN